MRWLLLGAVGALVWWLRRNAGPDPREWPAACAREADRVRAAAADALQAGRRAAERRERELERELDEAGR